MLRRVHLVRHGEVENPDGVVYADLPGFSLSAAGRAQAVAAGKYLARNEPEVVISSPLDRAVETARAIALETGAEMTTDDRLFEWRLSGRWAGVRWDDLSDRFPGELEAYLQHPYDLAFSPESLEGVASRMLELIDDLDGRDVGIAVLVSHQDPVQAARVALSSATSESFGTGKPSHASVIALERHAGAWVEAGYWEPEIGSAPFPPRPVGQ